MVFNTYDFLIGFLPPLLALAFVARALGGVGAVRALLLVASLGFYAWYHPPYLLLLLLSMVGNLMVGRQAMRADLSDGARYRWAAAGVATNIGLLAAFKYEVFVRDNIEALTGWAPPIPELELPLAISFFTFQQVGFLVDAYRREVGPHTPWTYALFVAFFPQLIAGPIVHHSELLPQVQRLPRPTWHDGFVGLAFLSIGMVKKVLIADSIAPYADVVYGSASLADPPTMAAAWTGGLAFFFQVYFDFSGYSDIAIGLARLFGIRLPANFDAPYRVTNMNEFWRRWHMTLGRFLFTYLYIPLGGGRGAPWRRDVNLLATMVVAGLWHGAAWTFAVFGLSHGVLMVIHRYWRQWRPNPLQRWWQIAVARLLFLFGLNLTYVFFRAPSFDAAWAMFLGLFGWTSAGLGELEWVPALWMVGCFVITQGFPTTQRLLDHADPVLGAQGLNDRLSWGDRWRIRPTVGWAVVLGAMLAACLPFLERADSFIYWAF